MTSHPIPSAMAVDLSVPLSPKAEAGDAAVLLQELQPNIVKAHVRGYRCPPKNSRVRSQARSADFLSYMDGASQLEKAWPAS